MEDAMKRVIAWMLCLLMVLTMGVSTAFAEEKDFTEIKPTLYSAKVTGFDRVSLSWKEVDGAEGYRVYRKNPGDTGWKLIKTVSATNYVDTTAKSGNTYIYTIRGCYTENGELVCTSYDAKGLTVNVTEPTVTLSAAKSNGIESIQVSWKKMDRVTGYRVYRKKPGETGWTYLLDTHSTTYVDTNVQDGTLYMYTVRAYLKKDGNLRWSFYDKNGVRATAKLPEQVKLNGATAGFSSATISWSQVVGADQYRVYRKFPGETAWKHIATVKSTSYQDNVLTEGKTYLYTVRGEKVKSGGNLRTGYDKNGVSITATVPKTVTLSSVSQVGFNGAVLKWKGVTGADGYRVYRKTAGGTWKHIANTTATSYQDTGLTPKATYVYTVRAYRKIGSETVLTGYDSKGLTLKVKSNVDPNKPMVAITYDDGPGKYTNQILDVLEKYNARATFFVVGKNVNGYPSTVKRAYNMGCEIGNHTYSHVYLTKQSVADLKTQISKTDAAVKAATGVTTQILRPPYGSYKTNTVKANVGKPIIMWSVDTRDWEHKSASKTLASVKSNVKDGSIILMHDIHKSTANAAESVVSYLKKQGYQLVTVSELAYYRGTTMKNGVGYGNFYKK